MNWRCKFCGFEIKDREDRRRIKIKEDKVYIIGICDNCLNYNILDTIPVNQMRNYITNKLYE
ncbi:hypothetical protein [Caldisalinibacter kiritimatiensis]|uniref:Uncharacterized protein n=1 Tax=Caldisalinibacter kiritimatiensis TaxID=1304284 RepID=R1CQI7_9FIRM|nr:hypothetical protein [Caldisalinibacter kiritimatiensis]EOD00931.1 hypothetical protein L21TH_1039 [Caldisalinibacter kiritimatiensis]